MSLETMANGLSLSRFKKNIRNNLDDLIDDIQPDELVTSLFQQRVLTEHQISTIGAITVRQDKNEMFMDILRTRPRKEIPTIIRCLCETNQEHIAEILIGEDEDTSGTPIKNIQEIGKAVAKTIDIQPHQVRIITEGKTTKLYVKLPIPLTVGSYNGETPGTQSDDAATNASPADITQMPYGPTTPKVRNKGARKVVGGCQDDLLDLKRQKLQWEIEETKLRCENWELQNRKLRAEMRDLDEREISSGMLSESNDLLQL